ncbi:hypothetical protein SFRURICE_002131 [Spodoptera frugiperda]|nr:hypothetical protein SFRURICE_002131 [Spodoptera frugiperda]
MRSLQNEVSQKYRYTHRYHALLRITTDLQVESSLVRLLVKGSRVELTIAGHFLVFRKFLTSSTESGIVPSIWQ